MSLAFSIKKGDEENFSGNCWAKDNRHRKLTLECFIFCGLWSHMLHIIQTLDL